ncbi:Putative phosphatase [Corynebacterium occultum]|uniref:Phosphatase n=1 Tax=Corynebacterium occultum TaxID=2675219 RepID=A0A6B8WEZ1_9CORY|nr:HAD family hydrolase [Corynebacterium occultum]QGU08550.1 Putative phosphatase [Corynebacterium occultum]
MDTAPRLVASDIDGTLLNSQDRVIPRLREVITRLGGTGAHLTLATGRPHRWLAPVLEQLPVRPVCVCANGAVIYDSASDRVLRSHLLDPQVMSAVVEVANEALAEFGGVGIAVERCGDTAFGCPEEYFAAAPDYMPAWEGGPFNIEEETAILAESSVKLLLRNENLSAAQMYELVSPMIDRSQAHVTFSMPEGLLEVAAPGVTKALGVELLGEYYEVPQAEIVCFGDMPNDIEMLEWAGLGVAMGNARPEVKAAADHVTGTNDEGGVAQVLERWF